MKKIIALILIGIGRSNKGKKTGKINKSEGKSEVEFPERANCPIQSRSQISQTHIFSNLLIF